MNILLSIIFAITLIYLSITERFRIFAAIIGVQGVLLFLLSFMEANVLTLGTLLFIVTETLLLKVLIIPYFLFKIIKKTGIARVNERNLSGFYSLLFVSLGLLLSIIIAFSLNAKPFNLTYFIVSFFALFTGLFLIISHKKIFSHLIGFLVIENAVFLLSLSIGSELPILLNIGVLLDLFISILILGIFAMRMRQHTYQLTTLKDD